MPENNIFPPAAGSSESPTPPMPGQAIDPFTGEATQVDPMTLQEIMSEALGTYVIVEFLIGTQSIVRREGVLNSVGQSWLVLYDETNDTSLLCDMYSVKFVTFFQPGVRPYQSSPAPAQSQQQTNTFNGRGGYRR